MTRAERLSRIRSPVEFFYTADMPLTTMDISRLIELDFAHVWHPFTPMRAWRRIDPVIIERAEGFLLIGADGKRYIDGHSSLWCNVHGHGVPEIDEAIREQLERVAHATMLGCATIPAIKLASELVGLVNAVPPASPSARLNKVFFSDSGATAAEVAFKMAAGHHYHRGDRDRNTFLAVAGGYHGDTVGAMSIGFHDSMHRPFERMLFQTRRTSAPDARQHPPTDPEAAEWPNWDVQRRARARDAALAELSEILRSADDRVIALVIEPLMQGAGGMVEQPDGFLAAAAERCRLAGALVIADEVATGLARTGAMLACDHERVRPDILCLAKGLTGGYLPLAATLCTDEIAESFEGEPAERKTLFHGHTYTGNPLAAAAALASLRLIERNGVVEQANRLGAVIRRRARTELFEHPNVGDVRQRGVMTGIELVASRRPWRSFDATLGVGAAVCAEAVRRGVMIRPLGDVIVLNPAPAMDESTLHTLLDRVFESIREFPFSE